MKNIITWAIAAVSSLSAMTATAVDFSLPGADVSLSGFGTVDYALSDRDYNIDRFVNKNGTFKRGSVFGLQADVKFTDQISATFQGKIAPSANSDSMWDPTLTWGFISWRPYNDLLFRLGKQRAPLYLYSESLDVGVTYDFAHLPSEMYRTAPASDYIGGSFSKSWNPELGELTLDGYAGIMDTSWRFYQRDNIAFPGSPTRPGANYQKISIHGGGAALTLLRDEDKYRISLHHLTANAASGQYFPAYNSLVPASELVPQGLAPFLNGSAYTVVPQAHVDKINSLVFTLGTEIKLPKDFRMIAEYSRRTVDGAMSGVDTNGGYFAFLKDIQGWTPYFSFAMIQSRSDALSLYQAMNTNPGLTVSQFTPPQLQPIAGAAAAGVNASQRAAADGLAVFDQNTIALGTSYRLTPSQKLKFEWALTHVNVASSFVDAPSGGNVSNQGINAFSFSYNVAF